jgi:hypothetical protein
MLGLGGTFWLLLMLISLTIKLASRANYGEIGHVGGEGLHINQTCHGTRLTSAQAARGRNIVEWQTGSTRGSVARDYRDSRARTCLPNPYNMADLYGTNGGSAWLRGQSIPKCCRRRRKAIDIVCSIKKECLRPNVLLVETTEVLFQILII